MKRVVKFLIVLSILLIGAGCSNETFNDKSGINYTEQIQTKSTDKNDIKETANPTVKVRSRNDSKDKIYNVNIKSKDISSFIPPEWHILEKNDGKLAKAEGDLNKDGIIDIAFVIERNTQPKQSEIELGLPRSLLIVFGDENNNYSLSIKADNAIMLRNQGGVFGDPFEDIQIDRGSVLLKFYGGSNWRWYYYYRFRFQNNGWYLIGATLGSYFTGNATMDNADEEDYNLLTGDYIIKKADENGKLITSKGNRGKRKLLNLKDFVAGADAAEF